MSKKITAFDCNETKKHKLHHQKVLILVEDLVIDNIPISNMVKKNHILFVTKVTILKLNHYT